MMYPVWAPIATCVDGSMPTYGTGRVLQEARSANVTKEINNNPLYGDDRIVDDDNGMTGMTVSFESTGLTMEDRVAVLGESVVSTSDDAQWEDDSATPYGGFGYIRVMRDAGVRKFEAYLILKIKFQEENQETATKEGSITWRTPTLNGRAAGCDVDGSGKLRFRQHKVFSSASAAKTWLNTKLSVPSPSSN
jgi:phi13 family phage major tail protein